MRYDKSIHPSWLNPVYISLSILLVIGVVTAFSIGYASIQYNLAKNHLEIWNDSGEVTSKDHYESAHRAINKATKWHPDNPVYQEIKATILVWGHYAGFESELALDHALKSYTDAKQSRPLWPWVWSEWVMTKWRLKQYDEEMLDGLLQLEEVGPFIGVANLTMVDAGLQLIRKRPEYSTQLVPLIEQNFRRSFTNGKIRKEMRRLVQNHENGQWLLDIPIPERK